MLPAFLLIAVCLLCQASSESEPVAWPLFEFWNPLTWLSPRFSSETIAQMLRYDRQSNKKFYQQLKKSLLPANLFFGNIRAQFAAWDSGKQKKPKTSPPRRPTNKRINKSSPGKSQ